MRQRRLPPTAGDRHGVPDRVFAPQRGLDSIGPVLRHWLLVIVVAERLRLFALLRNRRGGLTQGFAQRGAAERPARQAGVAVPPHSFLQLARLTAA
jgi:hypothetical protein